MARFAILFWMGYLLLTEPLAGPGKCRRPCDEEDAFNSLPGSGVRHERLKPVTALGDKHTAAAIGHPEKRGRQIITFIGHSFSKVNKDPLEQAWLAAGLYIFFHLSQKYLWLYITPVEGPSSAQHVRTNLPPRWWSWCRWCSHCTVFNVFNRL